MTDQIVDSSLGAGLMSRSSPCESDNVKEAFRKFDQGGTGLISRESFSEVMRLVSGIDSKSTDVLLLRAGTPCDAGLLPYDDIIDFVFGCEQDGGSDGQRAPQSWPAQQEELKLPGSLLLSGPLECDVPAGRMRVLPPPEELKSPRSSLLGAQQPPESISALADSVRHLHSKLDVTFAAIEEIKAVLCPGPGVVCHVVQEVHAQPPYSPYNSLTSPRLVPQAVPTTLDSVVSSPLHSTQQLLGTAGPCYSAPLVYTSPFASPRLTPQVDPAAVEVQELWNLQEPFDVAFVVAKLDSPHPNVRSVALHRCLQLDPAALDKHWAAIAARLEDSDPVPAGMAAQCIGRLPPEERMKHAGAIVAALEGCAAPGKLQQPVLQAALLQCLESLEPAVLARHVFLLSHHLENSDPQVRSLAMQCLRNCEVARVMQWCNELTMEPIDLQRTVLPAMWCVTLADLDDLVDRVREGLRLGQIPENPEYPDLHHNDPWIGPNMHTVNQHVIKPTTAAAGGMSWALMRHPEGAHVDFFCTHAWNEGIFEFHRKVSASWPPGLQHMWFCCLANPQTWSRPELAELLAGDPLRDSPFAQALTRAKLLLVVPNSTVSIYKRLWCVAEAKIAADHGIPIVVATEAAAQEPGGNAAGVVRSVQPLGPPRLAGPPDPPLMSMPPLPVGGHGSGGPLGGAVMRQVERRLRAPLLNDFVSVAEAACSDPDDERRIRAAIKGQEADIDELVRSLVEKGRIVAPAPILS